MDAQEASIRRDRIVIGASAGGVEALRVIASGLPADLNAAVLVVMHMSSRGPNFLPQILAASGPLPVGTAVDGTPIESGKIYVAPPDHHLLVNEDRIRLTRGPKENRSRPAIDPLFRSAARNYGPRAVAVILTGMLDDGVAGLAAIKQRGGLSVVQDPEEALYPSMPKSALLHVGADFIGSLVEIAALLAKATSMTVPSEGRRAPSRLMDVETKFDDLEPTTMDDMDAVGSRAALTCPECHGPVWKIAEPKLDRFRCLVGHAYTAEAMLESQREREEAYLWQALRLLRERASLTFEMLARAEDSESEDQAAYQLELRQLQEKIAAVQAMVERDSP